MKGELGPLEMQVLGLLDATQASSVAEVQQRLAGQGLEYAYTTIMTVLTRLNDKGVVRRQKHGARFLYRAMPRNAELKRGIMQKMQRALFSDRVAPIAAFLDQDLNEKELRELRALIDARLRKK
ncbi:MAG: BlaI/MecI/CopY family transcriptional regulator [Polyangiaceae bacterium]